MNTPSHIVLGLAVFSKADAPKITAAAFAGALLPDLSLYLMAGYHLLIAGTPPDVVFNDLYFSDAWMAVFAVDNSLILWGAAFALALRQKWPALVALTGAALLHILLDFPLHHDDGRPHFWPLTDWIYESPLSYWDREHGAHWIGPLESLAVMGGLALLWVRHRAWTFRLPLLAIGALQLYTAYIWLFVFSL